MHAKTLIMATIKIFVKSSKEKYNNYMKFCSLDIESTGFNPLEEEIIEIGWVFFDCIEGEILKGNSFSQLFKPGRPVSAKILGLTGITQIELDQAPGIVDFKDEMQKVLKDAVLVGHNIKMDIAFLEAAGIKTSGKKLDTLELAQFILPTNPSYNLENLMHALDLAKTSSHRALADSETSIGVLERLLQAFCSLSDKTRKEALKLVDRINPIWHEVLSQNFPPKPFHFVRKFDVSRTEIKFDLPDNGNALIEFPLGVKVETSVLAQLASNNDDTLCVLSDKLDVLHAWQAGLAEGIFSPSDTFDNTKFEELLDNSEQDPDLLIFLLKILVWKATNWQTKTILDLNLSFFGSQFRSFVTGGQIGPPSSGTLACDLTVYSMLKSTGNMPTGYKVVICGLERVEKHISDEQGFRISWRALIQKLLNAQVLLDKTFPAFHDEAQKMIHATDLFFGVFMLYLRKKQPKGGFLPLNQFAEDDYTFSRIQSASLKYWKQINDFSEDWPQVGLKRYLNGLKVFFGQEEQFIRWVEHQDESCILVAYAKVLDSKAFLSGGTSIADNMLSQFQVREISKRLGIVWPVKIAKTDENWAGTVFWDNGQATDNKILEILKVDALPAVVCVTSPSWVKRLYDSNYPLLSNLGGVYAQGYSGGSNKISQNFKIRENNILIATPNFLTKTVKHSLPIKTLIIASGNSTKTEPDPAVSLIFNEESAGVTLAQYQEITDTISVLRSGVSQKLQSIHILGLNQDEVVINAIAKYIHDSSKATQVKI